MANKKPVRREDENERDCQNKFVLEKITMVDIVAKMIYVFTSLQK